MLKRILLSLAFLVAYCGVAEAQIASEIANGGGGGVAVAGGSGTAGRIPVFAAGPTLADSRILMTGTNLGTATLYDQTAVTGVSTIAVRAGAGQSTTALLEARNNANTIVSSISAGGLFLAPAGAVGAPGVSFLADPNTGLYSVGADNPGMAAGGVLVQSWTTTGTTVVGTMAATTVTGAGTVSGLTTPAIPYATGANTLADSGLYRAAAARIGLGGTTDSEPGFRWSGTTIDFVTAGAGAFIRINALEYQVANTTVLKNSSDGLLEITDSLGATGGLKIIEMQGANSTALSDNTIADVVTISSAVENNVTGGHIDFVAIASDATNKIVQAQRGTVPFLLVNENGTVTVTLGTVFGTATDSAGGAAFTNVFASSVSGTDATIRVTSDYDQATLTGTVTHAIKTRVYIDSGMATITPIP